MPESKMSKSEWHSRLVFLLLLIVTIAVAVFTSFLFITPETEAMKNTAGNSFLLPLYYVSAIVLFSIIFIILARKKKVSILKTIVTVLIAYSTFLILLIDFSMLSYLLDIGIATVLTGLLLYYSLKKVRIVTYILGIVMGAGVAVILASFISIRIAIIMLAALSIYDSVSVNVSGTMIEIAETAIDSGLPLLYTAGKDDQLVAMGFGDTIIPTFGLLSVFVYYNYSLEALLVPLIFVLISFFPMIYLASRRPQPGLPYMLNALFLGIIVYIVFFV